MCELNLVNFFCMVVERNLFVVDFGEGGFWTESVVNIMVMLIEFGANLMLIIFVGILEEKLTQCFWLFLEENEGRGKTRPK